MMNIKFNSEELIWNELDSLADLLEKKSYIGNYFSVMRNKKFIPRRSYATTFLKNGDEIDVILPMQGG